MRQKRFDQNFDYEEHRAIVKHPDQEDEIGRNLKDFSKHQSVKMNHYQLEVHNT